MLMSTPRLSFASLASFSAGLSEANVRSFSALMSSSVALMPAPARPAPLEPLILLPASGRTESAIASAAGGTYGAGPSVLVDGAVAYCREAASWCQSERPAKVRRCQLCSSQDP